MCRWGECDEPLTLWVYSTPIVTESTPAWPFGSTSWLANINHASPSLPEPEASSSVLALKANPQASQHRLALPHPCRLFAGMLPHISSGSSRSRGVITPRWSSSDVFTMSLGQCFPSVVIDRNPGPIIGEVWKPRGLLPTFKSAV